MTPGPPYLLHEHHLFLFQDANVRHKSRLLDQSTQVRKGRLEKGIGVQSIAAKAEHLCAELKAPGGLLLSDVTQLIQRRDQHMDRAHGYLKFPTHLRNIPSALRRIQ